MDKAVEKFSHVLHVEAFHKAVSLKKPAEKQPKMLHFSQESRSIKLSGPQSSQPASGGAPLLPLSHCLPRPSLPLASAGVVRGFEGSSPPHLQVGGVLRQHDNSWLFYGVEGWTVEILRVGYHVLFNHLPPVTREPWEFPS